MTRNVPVVLAFLTVMVVVIVTVDVLFFRNRFGERLLVNAGVVALFVAFYFALLKSR